MVEAPPVPRDDRDVRRSRVPCSEERESEVGRILGRGIEVDRHAGSLRRLECIGRDRVEVADELIHVDAVGAGVVVPGVGRDHERAGRQALDGAWRRWVSASEHDHSTTSDSTTLEWVHVSLRWHYPDQVLGSVALMATLSARLPELPVVVALR